ncbi:hypothetical protein ABZN20_06080 [Methylococcus sp. ANG]|uniref:hypothetical protein n=1 Tax=Methylococcus sp. ANG TaxID=3231903 RepID=UPI00345B12B2
MREHVQARLAPGQQLAIEPDQAIAIVKGIEHGAHRCTGCGWRQCAAGSPSARVSKSQTMLSFGPRVGERGDDDFRFNESMNDQ